VTGPATAPLNGWPAYVAYRGGAAIETSCFRASTGSETAVEFPDVNQLIRRRATVRPYIGWSHGNKFVPWTVTRGDWKARVANRRCNNARQISSHTLRQLQSINPFLADPKLH